ncbi:sigma 54 modulation/S30EA ribosomal C-terminal domain-containing protein [Amycolatopsis sp. NPDC005003]
MSRTLNLAVDISGDVVPAAREYVRRRIGAVLRRVPGQVESAKLKLTVYRKPAVPRPALVQANLVVDGQPVRAQLTGVFFQEAATLLRKRLGEQLARLQNPAVPRPWPPPPGGPPSLPRPTGQREIVRHKRCPLRTMRPDDAALTMDLMDYRVHLFVDADTGEDAVVYRGGPTGYRLSRPAGLAPPAGTVTAPWVVDVHPVPRLTAEAAGERLDALELPFLFFRDSRTGRGAVLYLRYDGHYGLVTAA